MSCLSIYTYGETDRFVCVCVCVCKQDVGKLLFAISDRFLIGSYKPVVSISALPLRGMGRSARPGPQTVIVCAHLSGSRDMRWTTRIKGNNPDIIKDVEARGGDM